MWVKPTATALAPHIAVVVANGPEKQVAGSNAEPNVATVADDGAFGDREVVEFIGQAVGGHALSVTGDDAVPVVALRAGP
jgi:hypothetical protein